MDTVSISKTSSGEENHSTVAGGKVSVGRSLRIFKMVIAGKRMWLN